MIHFSYTGQGETLCGEPQLETDLKDGEVCNECIHVMWNEQYRRNTLNKLVKLEKKTGIKTTPKQKEKVIEHQMNKLFLKDWRKYGVKT